MIGPCRACGRPHPGPVAPDSIVAIGGPRDRAIPGNRREHICLRCQWSAYNAMTYAARQAATRNAVPIRVRP